MSTPAMERVSAQRIICDAVCPMTDFRKNESQDVRSCTVSRRTSCDSPSWQPWGASGVADCPYPGWSAMLGYLGSALESQDVHLPGSRWTRLLPRRRTICDGCPRMERECGKRRLAKLGQSATPRLARPPERTNCDSPYRRWPAPAGTNGQFATPEYGATGKGGRGTLARKSPEAGGVGVPAGIGAFR